MYLPASSSDDDLSTTLDQLSAVLEGRDSDSLNLVCGYYNGDIGTVTNGRGIGPPTKAGKLVHDFFARHQLWPVNQSEDANGPPGGSLGYLGGRMRSLSKLKITPKALVSGQKSTLILIKR